MALRDWLTLDLSAGLAETTTGLATISKPLAQSANLQGTDYIGENTRISRISRIGRISISNASELKKQGMKRLEVAAAGLPVTLDELAEWFADDLVSFGTGEVKQAGIRKACEWFAFQHLGRYQPPPEPTPKEAGMVKCSECLQDRCSYRRVTPYGNVVLQSSTQWRWCSDYTAKVHNLDEYRKR